tara:strand:- start:472 stop:996 length:525 start_codon:yes stop_codon:yes gene_type:complete
MILDKIIKDFESSADEITAEIAKGLQRKRGGYTRKHNTTGDTAKSTEMEKARYVSGNTLIWDFGNTSGNILNTGWPDVPYTDNAGGSRGGDSLYIGAIITWVGNKYGKYGEEARRLAFQIANSARENNGNVIKHTGWFDEIEHKVAKLCARKLNLAIRLNLESEINKKLPKKIN